MNFRLLVPLCLMTAFAPAAPAELVPAPLFTDHTVLQCDRPVPVWGRATPGAKVEVTFRDQTIGATTTADGRWIVYLAPLAASIEPAELMISAGAEKLVLHDVVVGEVWLAAGQSNMEWPVSSLREDERKLAAIDLPLVRHLKVEHRSGPTPADVFQSAGWKTATVANVGEFTAVGYFFARDLQRKLGVPVGLVHSSWGGTAIESWMSDACRATLPIGATIEARWQQSIKEWPPERVARYPAEMEAWQKADAHAKATKTKNLLPWPQPPATADSPARPGGPFNAMIAPLQPVAVRGVLWYQGESNVGRPDEYAELFPALIRAWRANWGDANLPFLFVQLPNYADNNPRGRAWARLREVQTQALDLPAVWMAVAIDLGEPDNLHPTRKLELGRRLALIAKNQVYGIPGDYTGPVFAGATREGAAMRVRFTHAATGLIARDRPPQALELAGADKVFHPATAKIQRDTLLVTAKEVREPVAVRYAWSNAPTANLYSGAGLPVIPFRSDSW
jgi:sialate O-acetylesterase